MNEAFAKDQRKRQEKYLKPPLDQQIKRTWRAHGETPERLARPLSATQEQRVMAWSNALGDQNTPMDRQPRPLAKAVQCRRGATQKPQNSHSESRRFWSIARVYGQPDYRKAFAKTEAQARALFVDLMAESTPEQRERLLKKIEGVRKDFSDLKCLKAAQQG